MVSGFPI